MMYLINFVLCSGLLLAVYKLFLQNERMYRFNRFYLLFSLVFSAVVPFVVITTESEAIPVVYQQAVRETLTPVFDTAPQAAVATKTQAVQIDQINYWPMLLIGIYLLIAGVLIIRFILNLIKISREVVANQHTIHQGISLVLTDAEVTPHSFLNYIFVNRKDHQQGTIEPQVICHERAHVKQLHSLDVLFIELMQALCWFNSFIPFYRKAIQLNHEFLADEAVTSWFDDTPAYQYLLLARASQAGSLQLTSPFNYQTTKKRLIMMTKTTSAAMATVKQLAVLPVMIAAVFIFCQRVAAQTTPSAQQPAKLPAATKDLPQSSIDEYNATLEKYAGQPNGKGTKFIMTEKFTAKDKARLIGLYKQMSPAQQEQQVYKFDARSGPMAKKQPTKAELLTWKKAGAYRIWIGGKRIENSDIVKYAPEDFDHYMVHYVGPGTKMQVNLMTKAQYARYYKAYTADTTTYQFMQQRFPPPVVKPDVKS
ncbi:M56 family metallopeptidase [Mucilaginibacter myungsuensis]|uniref:M56 family metallopeptidase n=1 Tax=Mucilaginibacter myungsuensis TaxID=649104 RepID=A0A929KZI6_9SPHI|nr:M56 family metallopeptidase [Mucilaginibacter myungsuensis]MBE9662828.1 M56 family metallopeptidase [Mucilaginibacter myungsuensis]MDN3598248.1 M56 family metallopeptidase [Mucilaginibacter myungsuensis]